MHDLLVALSMAFSLVTGGGSPPAGNETVATKQAKAFYDRIEPEPDPAPVKPLADRRRG